MQFITIAEVEHIAHKLAKKLMDYNQPIPDFKSRVPHRLESCLETPLSAFGGREFYPTFMDKAAILFYLLNKNHCFPNGNKRVAVMTLLTLLYINDLWLNVTPEGLLSFAEMVAASKPKDKDSVQAFIKFFLERNIVNRDNTNGIEKGGDGKNG